MTKEELEEAQRETAQIFMHERILEYLVQLAQATREHEMLELGMSPRGTVALAKMAKAGAYLAGREYVVPADVRGVFRETAQHRILLNTRARISKVKQKEVLQEILSAVESPSLKSDKKERIWETDDNISSGAWRSGISVFDVYLSGTERAVDFCASVSGGRNRLSYFCGERTFCQSKAALGLRRKRTANESQYTGLQGKFSLDRKVQDSAGNGTCSIRHQTKDSLWLSEKQADYTFEPDRCGEWKLTITEVRIYDFIGILSVGKKQQEKERFTVLPKICAMPVEIGRRTREFPVEPETYSNERGGQDATEIYQIREYHIPDPVQMIHWKISAKAGK